ncbi:MAG TPA: histidine kinase, partial [Vicinamibacterales bacterium]|nr:histidine kinase [Vicinamibacterales bacterium]
MRQTDLPKLRIARDPQVGYPGIALLALIWLFVGTLAYGRQLAQANRPFDASLLPGYAAYLSCFLSWIPLTGIVFRIERRWPLGRTGWLRNLLVLALVSLPLTYVAAVLMLAIGTATRLTFGMPLHLPSPVWAVPIREVLGHQSLYWASAAGGWMVRVLLEAREAERRAARLMLEKSQLETSLRQTELDVLRMRLNPHFLFNSLQNISVLALQDPHTASRMLTKLGDLLRVSLRRDGGPETTLQAEVALTEAYLAIEQMRFGDRLSSLVDLAPGTEEALVPSFLLQPLVENAIRHGLQGVRERGIIAIRSRIDDGALALSVADNGSGPPSGSVGSRGIGLGATCERLARMYPGEHTFSMHLLP